MKEDRIAKKMIQKWWENDKEEEPETTPDWPGGRFFLSTYDGGNHVLQSVSQIVFLLRPFPYLIIYYSSHKDHMGKTGSKERLMRI